MHWDQIESQWHQVKGHVKSSWTRLTEADVKSVAGRREVLVTTLQARYGVLREEAESQINAWLGKFAPPINGSKHPPEKDTRLS